MFKILVRFLFKTSLIPTHIPARYLFVQNQTVLFQTFLILLFCHFTIKVSDIQSFFFFQQSAKNAFLILIPECVLHITLMTSCFVVMVCYFEPSTLNISLFKLIFHGIFHLREPLKAIFSLHFGL